MKKISLEDIHKKIASIGHDTKLETANEEAYGKLAMCCKYRDEEVVKTTNKRADPLFFIKNLSFLTSCRAFLLHPLVALQLVFLL